MNGRTALPKPGVGRCSAQPIEVGDVAHDPGRARNQRVLRDCASAGAAGAARPGLAWQVAHSVTIDPSFAPDGRRMVYITVVAGIEQLFVADSDGANARQIARDDLDH